MGKLTPKQRFYFGVGGISVSLISTIIYFKFFGIPKEEKKDFQKKIQSAKINYNEYGKCNLIIINKRVARYNIFKNHARNFRFE
jgi:hypothetical protein